MLKYLIIVLDNSSVPFCHYESDANHSALMPLDLLKNSILFGMKQNLMIQFVYPSYELPKEYVSVIETIDHINIKPQEFACKDDVCVTSISSLDNNISSDILIVRGNARELSNNAQKLFESIYKHSRVNIVLAELQYMSESDVAIYSEFLNDMVDYIFDSAKLGRNLPQVNILTDRLTIDKMNNCNAGYESITIAPNGKLYICPGFYYDGERNIEIVDSEVTIPNQSLYDIVHAPICRQCDAYQCHRCVWLNKRKTLEVNTPSRIQCNIAHIERNASLTLLKKLRELGPFMCGVDIPEIDYLDPFEKITKE